jgi:TrpR family trp operon transcriptional repressor
MILRVETILFIETWGFAVDRMREISRVLARTDDEKIIESFLKSILTPSEIGEVSSRWELVKLLHEGMSQRKIAESLGLSLCKITRGSRELKKKNSPFLYMINLLKQGTHSQ